MNNNFELVAEPSFHRLESISPEYTAAINSKFNQEYHSILDKEFKLRTHKQDDDFYNSSNSEQEEETEPERSLELNQFLWNQINDLALDRDDLNVYIFLCNKEFLETYRDNKSSSSGALTAI